MGSFPGHVLPGTLFLVIGVWHIWSALVRYSSNPKSFRVRVWNPVPGFNGKLKYLEVYVIAIGAFIDFCIELFYSTHLRLFVHGALNPTHMNNFEHAGMLLMFVIFGLIVLLSEKTRCLDSLDCILHAILGNHARKTCFGINFYLKLTEKNFEDYTRHQPHHTCVLKPHENHFLPLPDEALCLIVATAFAAEYFLFFFHSTTHKGLEGYYHLILVLLIGLCILTTIAGALMPTSFPIDLASGISVALQGLWFYQTAFTLYGPMMPDGCQLKGDNIMCRSADSEVRGELLANFQLFSMIFVVLAATVGAYGFAASEAGHSESSNSHVPLDG